MKESFNFWVPLEENQYLEKATKTEKGDSKRYENMYLAGMASNNAKDSEGEVLEPSGYDLSRFLKSGFINFEHKSKNDPKYIIGEPVEAQVKGDEFHVKGKLYKESEIARNLWDTAIVLKKSDSTRKLGWSIEGRATERSISDPKRITKALITGIALTFSPVNTNSFADICKGEQKDDYVEYEYDLVEKAESESKYLYEFSNNGKKFGITKSFQVEEIDKCMDIAATKPLVPESLDKKPKVLEPVIRKAIIEGIIPIERVTDICKAHVNKYLRKEGNKYIYEEPKIVDDVNSGKIINETFTEWNKIKTQRDHDKWSEKVGKLRFGTYKNKSILDIIEDFNPSFGNDILKRGFYGEIKLAIKKFEN